MTLRANGGAAVALALTIPFAAHAATEADLDRLIRKIDELERRQVEDARRIEELERRLRQAQPTTPANQRTVAVTPAARPGAGAAPPSLFNPAISVILDGKLGAFDRDPDDYQIAGFALGAEGPGQRGLFLGETEVNLYGNIDDLFFGSLTAALEYDDGETEIELEEAYIQTLGLPFGLQATAGKFFSGVGYLNRFHRHADDFADRPLAYRAFLADQFSDPGLRVAWIAPTELFIQAGAEAFRGTSFPAEGAENDGIGAHAAFLKLGDDIGANVSWQAGVSWLSAEAGARETGDAPDVFAGRTDIAIAHAVLRWAPDGDPSRRNLKLQAEVFRQALDGDFNGVSVDRVDFGAYAQAVFQFAPRWAAGYRFDWLDADGVDPLLAGAALDDQGHEPTRHSVMAQYSHSEFSRIRLQYNYDLARDSEEDHQLLLQYTVTLGAHPPHQF